MVKSKFQRLLSCFAALCILTQTMYGFSASAITPEGFEGGEGSETNPWKIKTLAQLQLVRKYPTKSFLLIDDITLSGTWEPIGYNATNYRFSGIFDGGGHTISGLYAHGNRTSATSSPTNTSNFVGLFGYTQNAKIKNLRVSGSKVSGASYIGSVVGYADGLFTMDNVHSSVDVFASSTNSGGLVGYAPDYCIISNSSYSGNIDGEAQTGGIVGYARRNELYVPAIFACKVTGTVEGSSDVGGIVGQLHGNVNQSYSEKGVYGTGNYVGGIAGRVTASVNNHGWVDNCYSWGDIEGGGYVGGIVGYLYESTSINCWSAHIENCYVTGKITSRTSGYTGGIVAYTTTSSAFILGAVRYCVVLSPSVNQKNTGNTIGQVVGYNPKGESNLYRSDLVVAKNGTPYSMSQNIATAVPLSTLFQEATYTARAWNIGTANTIWSMQLTEKGYLPVLNNSPMPFSLNKSSLLFENPQAASQQLISNPTNIRLTWWSDNPAIATVDNSGKVTPGGKGVTTVWAQSSSGYKQACAIVVDKANPEPQLTLAVSMYPGEFFELSAFHNADITKISWQSLAPEIATVDSGGLVTAVSPGIADLFGRDENGKTVLFKVAVKDRVPVTSILLEKSTLDMLIGQSEPVEYTLVPENATNSRVSWVSSNPLVATVDSGIITAVSSGTAIITAVSADGNHTANISVFVEYEMTNISVSPATATLIVGDKFQLTAEAAPESAKQLNVTWSSSDDIIATVSESGEVTALIPGTVTITATTEDGISSSTEITVRALIQETLAAWTSIPITAPYLPTLAYNQEMADFSLITGEGVTIQNGASSSELRSTGWTFASTSTRAWQATFVTSGFKNIKISSIQTANNKSPNNFVLEYSLNGREWTRVAIDKDINGDPIYDYYIRLANDKAAQEKKLDSILLPEECNNKSRVLVHWRSTNDQGPNDAVASTAPAIIKNIVITGEH